MGALSFKHFCIVAAVLATAGCASPRFEADVVRFHEMPGPSGQGQSVTIAPADPAQAGLEFGQYANLIGARLGALGFQPAALGAKADLIATVGFSVTKFAAIDSGDSPVKVGVGVGGVGRHVGVSVGTLFGVGDRASNESFVRTLSVRLTHSATGAAVFEGRVTSEGKEGDLSAVMPYMVDALFENFPGPNGVTAHIERAMTTSGE